MKRKFIIILINLIFLSGVYFGFDYYLKHKTYGWAAAPEHPFFDFSHKGNDEVDLSECETEGFPENFTYLEEDFNKLPPGMNPSLFVGKRESFGSEYIGKALPIVVIGGSYAYGHGMKASESFPARLAQYTHRPVFSFAVSGGSGFTSVEKIYSEISKNEELKKLLNSAEYVIYVHMSDHINRYLFVNGAKEYNVKFIPSPLEKFLTKPYTIRYIVGTIRLKYYSLGFPEIKMPEKFLKKMLINLNKHVKTFAPHSKFIIILYDEKISFEAYANNRNAIKFVSAIMKSDVWNQFAKETGATVVHTKDVTGFIFDSKYKLTSDFPLAGWHPSSNVWTLFTPLFVKKYLNDDDK